MIRIQYKVFNLLLTLGFLIHYWQNPSLWSWNAEFLNSCIIHEYIEICR